MKVNSAFDLLVKTKFEVGETARITPFKLGFKTQQKNENNKSRDNTGKQQIIESEQ